jgi:hypothetical protein
VRHRSRKPFVAEDPCHVTLRVRPGLRSLRDADVAAEIERAFRRGRSRGEFFRLVHYSIQDDHAHLIVEARNQLALGRGMKSLASLFAFAVNRALGRTGRVLADRYHLQILKSATQVRNALAYVLLNARRHAAKRIAKLRRSGFQGARPLPRNGRLDPASSARWFDGWRRDVALQRPPPYGNDSRPAVAEPRSWLLLGGWQRGGGLLDPNAIPGAV